jgi:TPR repeat protein
MTKRLLFVLILLLSFSGIAFSSEDKDFEQLKKRAEQGDINAQCDLASMYYVGKSIQQNYAEALNWFKKAAEKGHPVAQFGLGVMNSEGEGMPQNYIEGYAWLSMASAKGIKDAKQQLSIVKSKMTPEQIAEAQKKAAALSEEISRNLLRSVRVGEGANLSK